MSDDFHKFIFLGAMIVLAMFSNRSALYKENAASPSQKSEPPPLFILKSSENALAENTILKSNGAISQSSIQAPDASSSEPVSQNGPQASVVYPDTNNPNIEELLYPALQSPDLSSAPSWSRVGTDFPPAITASIATVADLKSGEKMFAHGEGNWWPIASITKLMTAAIAWNLPFTASTTLTDANFPPGDSEKNIKSGDRYSVADLMRMMLLESNNVAAEALASMGNREQFIAAMNAKASEWGIMGTHFNDPTGLSPANQSNQDDLLKLAAHIYAEYPDMLRTTKKLSATITELNSGKKFTIKNIDLLASRPDFLGGKTGFIDESSGNLLTLFLYERRPVFVLVMGSDDRFGDTEKLLNWFEKNYH